MSTSFSAQDALFLLFTALVLILFCFVLLAGLFLPFKAALLGKGCFLKCFEVSSVSKVFASTIKTWTGLKFKTSSRQQVNENCYHLTAGGLKRKFKSHCLWQ